MGGRAGPVPLAEYPGAPDPESDGAAPYGAASDGADSAGGLAVMDHWGVTRESEPSGCA